MSLRVAINGFGRVGRSVLRAAHEQGADLEFVAVNDLADARMLAQLLKCDSVFGRFPGEVEAPTTASRSTAGRPRAAEADPSALPWGELGVDVVIESTGRLRTRAAAASTSRPARARSSSPPPPRAPSHPTPPSSWA